jgi:hypothetical protein
MKDFRKRIVTKKPTVADVEALLREGQLGKALRRSRAVGVPVPQHQIDAVATKMFHSGRAGELLSLVGEPDLRLPFDTPTLLRRAFAARDYHTFLKQALRLGVFDGFEQAIAEAVAAIESRAPLEAAAWRQKLGDIASTPTIRNR